LKKWLQENLSLDGTLKQDADAITEKLMSKNFVTGEGAYERVSIVLSKYNRKNSEPEKTIVENVTNSNHTRALTTSLRDSVYSTNKYDFSDCDETVNVDDVPLSNASPPPLQLDDLRDVDLNLELVHGLSPRQFARRETPTGTTRDERSLSPRGKFNIGVTRARGTSESPAFHQSPRLGGAPTEATTIPSPRVRKLSKSVDAADRRAYPAALLAQQQLHDNYNSDSFIGMNEDSVGLVETDSKPFLVRKKATVGLTKTTLNKGI
jgi:hypothetical protein